MFALRSFLASVLPAGESTAGPDVAVCLYKSLCVHVPVCVRRSPIYMCPVCLPCKNHACLIVGCCPAEVESRSSGGPLPAETPLPCSLSCCEFLHPFCNLQMLFSFLKAKSHFPDWLATFEPLVFNSCKMTQGKTRNGDKQAVEKWHFITAT